MYTQHLLYFVFLHTVMAGVGIYSIQVQSHTGDWPKPSKRERGCPPPCVAVVERSALAGNAGVSTLGI